MLFRFVVLQTTKWDGVVLDENTRRDRCTGFSNSALVSLVQQSTASRGRFGAGRWLMGGRCADWEDWGMDCKQMCTAIRASSQKGRTNSSPAQRNTRRERVRGGVGAQLAWLYFFSPCVWAHAVITVFQMVCSSWGNKGLQRYTHAASLKVALQI